MQKTMHWVRRVIGWGIYAYIGFLVLYGLARLTIWESWNPIAFLDLSIPWLLFPIFLLPFIALLRKEFPLLITTAIMSLGLVVWLISAYWIPSGTVPANAPGLTVVSMNLGGTLVSPDTLHDYVSRLDADVICLQEVTQDDIDQAWPAIKDLYPYQVHTDWAYLGVLSRKPIITQELFQLTPNGFVHHQRVTIQFAGRSIAIYNVQLSSPSIQGHKIGPVKIPHLEYTMRSRETQALIQKIQAETLPAVISGDLGMTDQTQDYSKLMQVTTDAFHEAGAGLLFNWPDRNASRNRNFGPFPFALIDHIIHTPGWVARSARVLGPTGSDHLPIQSTLFLTTPASGQ